MPKSEVIIEKLMCMLLNLMKRSLQIELDSFVEQHIGSDIGTYTKRSFSESRQKLKPKAFNMLNEILASEYYALSSTKGYHILAIDGSKLQIPNNSKTSKKCCGKCQAPII